MLLYRFSHVQTTRNSRLVFTTLHLKKIKIFYSILFFYFYFFFFNYSWNAIFLMILSSSTAMTFSAKKAIELMTVTRMMLEKTTIKVNNFTPVGAQHQWIWRMFQPQAGGQFSSIYKRMMHSSGRVSPSKRGRISIDATSDTLTSSEPFDPTLNPILNLLQLRLWWQVNTVLLIGLTPSIEPF